MTCYSTARAHTEPTVVQVNILNQTPPSSPEPEPSPEPPQQPVQGTAETVNEATAPGPQSTGPR
ncbi:hypothetical protein SARC_16918, partial [Sphaeroforma arctica JP610]